MDGQTGDSLMKRMYADNTLREPSDILKILKEFTLCSRDNSFRMALTEPNIRSLTDYFQLSAEGVSSEQALAVECCTECLRCLRNACAGCVKNQELVLTPSVIPSVRQLLTFLLEKSQLEDPYVVLLRCCVQFLNNLVSGFENGQRAVWKDIILDLMHRLLQIPDSKVTQYSCMLLQALLESSENILSFAEAANASKSLEAVLVACSEENEHDFSLQLVQCMLRSSAITSSLFDQLSISSQIILLHIASACISSESRQQHPEIPKTISDSLLLCFAQKFKSTSHCILSLAMKDGHEEDQNPQLVMSLLDVLCAVSAETDLQSCLQEMDFVLEASLELLEMVEQVGRSSNNAFSVKQDLTGTATADAAEPGYGFKTNLVQLIGNLCFRHRRNQDRVRELKGIPTILQQCNIDSKNAFINQWAILAIRNLCENNLENQAVLLSLENQGVADNEALARLGYEAAMGEDGHIYLKNLKR
ncbi:ataxin-10-like [Lytechinus variegatus]|uniref:ataxin-10-like n=1 Tax=Lytechinus variegatus TaxID=7654 RepID=UPI001BB2953C|nr:ataxin-10-like [Lytechinus variegatus]